MRITRPAILKAALAILVLGLFYWGLFILPKTGERPVLTAEESRKLLEQSKSLLRARKFDEALVPTEKLYKAYPDDHIYIEQMADIYRATMRYGEESAMWEQFRQHAPRPITACPMIGQAYQNQGLLKEALAAYEWCLSLDPENTDSIFHLAHALERAGEWDRAAELYQRGLKISPEYADLRIGLARVLLHLDQPAQAKEEAASVVAISPDNSDALFALGMAYYQEGDYLQARQNLEKGVQISEGNVDFHVALGKLAEKENKSSEALRHYDRAVELSPENDEIRGLRDDLKGTQ